MNFKLCCTHMNSQLNYYTYYSQEHKIYNIMFNNNNNSNNNNINNRVYSPHSQRCSQTRVFISQCHMNHIIQYYAC